ncbi:MAG: hypothetical protein HY870_23935 [Chloroflexi bacterium]|nr:hypothetical protein [Chloroflexota bacterium]
MRTKLSLSLVVIVVLLATVSGANARFGATAPTAPQAAVGSGFTFQGQLKNAGATVNGNCDMTFRLYDAAATGAQIGSTITATVPVSNSLFTVMLNTNGEYGANAFNGYARWLEVGVKCAGDPAFTTLSPRQQITAAPYAQYSLTGNSAPHTPHVPLYRPQTLDLATVDPQLKGFNGAFTDGQYGYFVPGSDGISYVGKVARVDLNSYITTSVTVLDLTTVDAALKAFASGFSDGRYGYFVPNSGRSSGKVARLDLQNFSVAGVTVLDLTTVDPTLIGFAGGFSDGHYAYLAPETPFLSKVVRINLQDFSSTGVSVLDLAMVDPALKGFLGGFTDGRYGYFVPYRNPSFFGKLVRVDLQNFAASGVTVLDLASIDSSLVGFAGGFTDGRYGYIVPNGASDFTQHGKFVRVDLQNFSTGGVTVLDLTTVNPSLRGYHGGVAIGGYAYIFPYYNSVSVGHGEIVRVDLQNFSASGVTYLDTSLTDSGLKGFYGGFTDGQFIYLSPYASDDTTTQGKVARIQLFSGAGAP